MSSSDSQQDPSMVGGHAQYVKAAAVETIGSVTGSEEWRSSGAAQKAEAVEEMRAANEQRQSQSDGSSSTGGYGAKAEELAGKAVGCEGMEKEGREAQQQ